MFGPNSNYDYYRIRYVGWRISVYRVKSLVAPSDDMADSVRKSGTATTYYGDED